MCPINQYTSDKRAGVLAELDGKCKQSVCLFVLSDRAKGSVSTNGECANLD